MSPFWVTASAGDSCGTALRGESWLVSWSGDSASLLSSSKDELSPPAPFGESVTEQEYLVKLYTSTHLHDINSHDETQLKGTVIGSCLGASAMWPVNDWTLLVNLEILTVTVARGQTSSFPATFSQVNCWKEMTNLKEVIQHLSCCVSKYDYVQTYIVVAHLVRWCNSV